MLADYDLGLRKREDWRGRHLMISRSPVVRQAEPPWLSWEALTEKMMQVTIDGDPIDAQIALKRNDPRPSEQNLYVNGRRVVRVTHSRSDEIPAILVLDNDAVVEVEKQAFYTIDGMTYDWQPGAQPDAQVLG